MLVENGAEVDAKEKSMQQTALMFAAGTNRVDAIAALLKAGADVKLTSKVNNVGNLSGAEQEFRRSGVGQRRPAGRQCAGAERPGERGSPAPARGQWRWRRWRWWTPRWRRRPGRRRSAVLLQRAGRLPGRRDAAAVRRARRLRRGRETPGRRRRGRESGERGRQDQPAADRHHQRPFRPREVAARSRRQSECGLRQRRDAALCRAQRDLGAARALSAAARVPAAAADLSRFHEGAARQGRESEPASHEEGVVRRVQLRPRRRRRNRRDAVLARRLRGRRRRDEAPDGLRRRPEHPDDEAGRPAARRRLGRA